MLVTITNKKTGETRQVDDSQLGSYGLSTPTPQPPSKNQDTSSQSDQSGSADPEKEIFRKGVLGWLTNQLPVAGSILGSIGGAGVGGLLGIETGPGAIATSIAGGATGGATGGAGGEWLKEQLQGTPQNTGEIKKQAILGGVGGAAGEVARPVLGAGVRLASKIPLIGTAIKSISNLGDSALMKIFGAGDVANGAGVGDLVQTAKKFGLHKAPDIAGIAEKTNSALMKTGLDLGDVLASADKKGVGITYDEAEKLIDDAGGKMVGDQTQIDTLVKQAKAKLAGSLKAKPTGIFVAGQTGIPEGETNVSASVLNSLKQFYADAAKYGSKTRGVPEDFAAKLSNGYKTSVENATKGIADVKQINQDWWNLKQISKNVGRTANTSSRLGGRGMGLTPNALLRTPAAQLTLSKGTQASPDIASQFAIRSGQGSSTLPLTPSDVNFPKTQGEIKASDIDIDGRLKTNPDAPYSKQQFQRAMLKALQRGDSKSATRYKVMYDLLYPKVKSPTTPKTISGVLQNSAVNLIEGIGTTDVSQLPSDASQVQFAQ